MTEDLSQFDHHQEHHREGVECRWARLREMPGLPRSDKYGGFHLVTRHADLRKAAAQHAIFSCAQGVALPNEHRTRHIPEEVDPPLHREYRRILEPFLTPEAVASLEPIARRHVLTLLDTFKDSDRLDFVSSFAEPLPIYFSLEVFGFPTRDAHMLNDLVSRLINGRGSEDGKQASQALTAYIENLLAQKAAASKGGQPGDVVTAIALSCVLGKPLSIEDKVSMTRLLLFGGFTTVNLALSYTFYLLATKPELVVQLRANPALLTTAVEEFIRLASPGTYLRRTVVADTQLSGTDLHPGDQVLLCFGAANRDPAIFERAEEVVLDRNPNPHVAFGFGTHRCMGSMIGKLEMRVALQELLQRYERFEIDPRGALEWGSGETQGLKALPLILHRRAVTGT
jgi:cytochrome P450